MIENPFGRLAPFIQEYIYAQGWAELRAVQVEACRVIFATDAHLLLSAGTSSGKTEAAFLPVLTQITENPPATVGVLYIGPTKALINDQFLRLNDLLQEADVPVWHWHGDVAQSQKRKLLLNPRGVLQITPESIESLLLNHSADLTHLFGNLRFVVIDEVHVFMGSERGRQILCQLERLSRYVPTEPRRIGLSATLGDRTLAEEWLRAGTKRRVITPDVAGGPQRVRLAVAYFDETGPDVDADDPRGDDRAPMDTVPSDDMAPGAGASVFERYVFEKSRGLKTLIFANNRRETESMITSLRQIAKAENTPDVYHVHHGSISAPLREVAEQAMRDPDEPAVVAATVTLELGIDIGQLERVIQLEAPFSVASFLQRLGRSGRRGNPSEMWIVCRAQRIDATSPVPEQIPWHLVQAIAIIQLYLEEHWIEPIPPATYPFSLVYHQTMSVLASRGELTPAALAQQVLPLPPFRAITRDDYRALLAHLVAIDHIQRTDEGGLIVGLTGEKIVRDFHFYAVFPDNDEYAVREEARAIGSIVRPPPPGERFGLAGRSWEVIEIDSKRKVVFARRAKGRAPAQWSGGGGDVHTRVLERMRTVLNETSDHSYLQTGARSRLAEARGLARSVGLEHQNVVGLGGHAFCIFPWTGSAAFRALQRYLQIVGSESLGITDIQGVSPYYLTVHCPDVTRETLLDFLRSISTRPIVSESLLRPGEALRIQKYDEFVPDDLLRKAFVADHLDTAALSASARHWR
ncbi:MAG TPA: DEAD/DEAH box helicase [Chloroflexota bacterium]|nr:DEAD/DEAH box helicase [Chloroflexota bacterium]